MGKKNLILAIGSWLCLTAGGVAFSEEILAVLSSEGSAYKEAFDGFNDAYGSSSDVVYLNKRAPVVGNDTKVVVAFGGKAALQVYPSRVAVVICLAPGVELTPRRSRSKTVFVHMLPPARQLVRQFKKIQPSMKTLAIFWISDALDGIVKGMDRETRTLSLAIRPEKLRNSKDLPRRLRALDGKADAIWVLPDPFLVTRQNFLILKEFSWAAKIPFYAPTESLVDKGAVGSISCRFRDIGRRAGRVAREMMLGHHPQKDVFPTPVRTVVSLTALRAVGLPVSQQILADVDEVRP